ncbi:hypothetical protein ACWCQL_08985 [Streptomyces sp. NPDC002073]
MFIAYETGYEKIEVGFQRWFAISPMRNTSDSDIELLHADLDSVPDGVKVTGYAAFDLHDTDGLPLTASDSDIQRLATKDRSKQPIPIKAETDSDVFYTVRLTVVRKQPSIVNGCRITYRHGGRIYRQKVHCTYLLGTTG